MRCLLSLCLLFVTGCSGATDAKVKKITDKTKKDYEAMVELRQELEAEREAYEQAKNSRLDISR